MDTWVVFDSNVGVVFVLCSLMGAWVVFDSKVRVVVVLDSNV